MNYVVGRLLCLNNLSRDWNVWHFFKGRYKLVFINDFTNVKIRQWMKCVFISFRVFLVLEFLRLSYLFFAELSSYHPILIVTLKTVILIT